MGDSHTRSYTKSSNFEKIVFLNQGKKLNFTSCKSFISFLIRYIATSLNYVPVDNPLVLIIGEPDVRLITYGTYDIRKSPNLLINSSTSSLPMDKNKLKLTNNSIKRIKKFICISKFFNKKPSILIGASTPNFEMSIICSHFNSKLRALADSHDIPFFDPTLLYLNDEKDRVRWISTAYNDPKKTDPIHFSSEAAIQFDSFVADTSLNHVTIRSAKKNIAVIILSLLLKAAFRLEYSKFFKVYKLKSRF